MVVVDVFGFSSNVHPGSLDRMAAYKINLCANREPKNDLSDVLRWSDLTNFFEPPPSKPSNVQVDEGLFQAKLILKAITTSSLIPESKYATGVSMR